MRYFPPRDDGPPVHAQSLGECRVGDWLFAMDVFHWRGREGRQYFQPDLPNKKLDGFDPATFKPGLEVFAFERGPCPIKDCPYDWTTWVRVE